MTEKKESESLKFVSSCHTIITTFGNKELITSCRVIRMLSMHERV